MSADKPISDPTPGPAHTMLSDIAAQKWGVPPNPIAADDPYLYTKLDEFTSEVFKIEIGGLPGNFGFAELKKLLNHKLNLKAHKLKTPGQNSKFAFVTFRCEEDREQALQVVNGFTWKGKLLFAKKANPAADPLVRKRQNVTEAEHVKRIKIEDDLPMSARLKEIVMPMCGKPYNEQIEIKKCEVKAMLIKLAKQIDKSWPASPKWLKQNRQAHSSMCCVLEEVIGSPVVEHYRNKCEFTVGVDPVDGTRTVGFRLAKYSAGSMNVGDPSECSIVPQKSLNLCKVFQEFVRQSDKEPYNPEKYSGYWRQFTVRTSENDCMVIVVMHPQDLDEETLAKEKENLMNFFTEGGGKSSGVTSLYYQSFGKRTTAEDSPMEHLCGQKYITESLMGLKFRISPNAFFQVNSAAASVLFNAVGVMTSVELNTILLDVCCGTGTIGISLAKRAKQVIGIEMVPSAVEDAVFNAQLNGLNNIQFHCGKVEDVLPSIVMNLPAEHPIVAIVDPPRAGLHNKVVRTLRGISRLQRVVYVSCGLAAASTNVTDFCRPESNNYHGSPFNVMKAIAVDLFPQTSHCEVILLLERS